MNRNINAIDKGRALTDLHILAKFTKYRKPTIAEWIEFFLFLIFKKRRTGEHVSRIGRYLRSVIPISDGKPFLSCVYIKANFVMEPSAIRYVLDTFCKETGDRAAVALSMAGVHAGKRIMSTKISEYDPDRGAFLSMDGRVPDWCAYYINAHLSYLRSIGFGDEELLFHRFSNDGSEVYTSKKIFGMMRELGRKSGYDLVSHAKLAYHYPIVPHGAMLKYV